MTHLRTLLLFVLGLAAAACSSPDQSPQGQAIPVRTITVAEADIDNVLELPGRVEPVRVAEVRARVTGIVQQRLQAVSDENVDLVAFEKTKIKGAIRTDFILSAEIIVISLGAVQSASFGVQVAAICAIALLMTVGVYSLVAGIVKLDDAGQHLMQTPADSTAAGARIAFGKAILTVAPWLMKTLSVVGTAAMFLVGGGILVHGIPGSHDWVHHLQEMAGAVSWLVPLLVNLIGGIVAGALVLAVVTMVSRLRRAWSYQP